MADEHTSDVEANEIQEKTQEKTFSIEEKKMLLSIIEENRCLWDSAIPDFLNKKKKHEALKVVGDHSEQLQTV